MDLSIVIPAYEENLKIQDDILSADDFLTQNRIAGEIIVVDDGSIDNTFESANSLKSETSSNLTVIKLSSNIGKGGAVSEGIKISKGDIVMYADAGLTVPYENALIGIDLIKTGKCDLANGSRKMNNSKIIKGQDFDRRFISNIFGFLVKSLLHIPKEMTDTQCGFKVYKGIVARELFQKLNITGFLFEIEIILLALKKDYKIVEFPVTWKCDRDSRLSISKSSRKIISDFIYLFRKYN